MSEVTETSKQLVAGNTVETLTSTDRDAVAGLPTAADLDASAAEKANPEATAPSTVVTADPAEDEDPLDYENTFDVSRAEFKELQDAFLRLTARVDKYNLGASHKI